MYFFIKQWEKKDFDEDLGETKSIVKDCLQLRSNKIK